VTEQEIVNHFAKAAKPRLIDLLKLKVKHVYETAPGVENSKVVIDGSEVEFTKVTTVQDYKGIERFVAEDKIIGFVVNPVRGRKMLVTRRIQETDKDKGVVAHLHDFGMRIVMSCDAGRNETHVTWECLYGVA
jgi:hypothetical protein